MARRGLSPLCYKAAVELCSFNGVIVPLAEARIDPRDRGFQFGDALYEVVKVAGGIALHLEAHLDRLRGGLHRVDIPIPDRLAERCRDLLRASGLDVGVALPPGHPRASRRAFADAAGRAGADGGDPPLVATSFDPPAGRPLAAVTLADPRWRHCDVKTTSLMGAVMGKLAAREAGADEVIFVGPEGRAARGGEHQPLRPPGGRAGDPPHRRPHPPRRDPRRLLRLAAAEGLPVVERAPLLAEREELAGGLPLRHPDRRAAARHPRRRRRWRRRQRPLDPPPRPRPRSPRAASWSPPPARPDRHCPLAWPANRPACHIPATSRPDPSPPQPSRRPAAALN